jgi:hypothetical protein
MWRCCVSQKWATKALAIAFCLAGWSGLASATETGLEEDLTTLLPRWDHSISLKASGGYKDNIGLASTNPIASWFARTAVDAVSVRLPVDSHQVTVVLTAEDTRYLQSSRIDHEDFVVAQAEYRKFWGDKWQASLGLEGIYLDQIVDVSVSQTNQVVRLHGGTLTARPGARRDFTQFVWLAVEAPLSRQAFFSETPLDEYSDIGTKVLLGWSYGHSSEIGPVYEFLHRGYDNELATRPGPTPANEIREDLQHEVGVIWKHYWDQRGHWRSSTRVNYRLLHDNGGYFNYHRYQVAHGLRFKAKPWDLSVEGRVGFYEFPNQLVDNDVRHRTDWSVAVRGERQLGRHLRLIAAYDYERTESNREFDQYAVNTVSAGMAWEF